MNLPRRLPAEARPIPRGGSTGGSVVSVPLRDHRQHRLLLHLYTLFVCWCKIVVMALNLKNKEVEELAAQVAELAGETKTEAIRRALLERRERIQLHVQEQSRAGSFLQYLEHEVWPQVDETKLGKRIPKEVVEEILGYGPHGV